MKNRHTKLKETPIGRRVQRTAYYGGVVQSTSTMTIIVIASLAGVIGGIVGISLGSVALSKLENGFTSPSVTVSQVLDYSMAQVKSAPEVIVIGTPVHGVESFPVTPEKKNIPIFPNPINPGGTFPPAGAIHVDTFREALLLLQGKVINDTTIYVHPGVYEENVEFEGFFSQCTGSSDLDESVSTKTCRGLTVVGDNRRIAGYSFVNDGYTAFYIPGLEFGSDRSRVSLTCLSTGAQGVIQVELTQTEESENLCDGGATCQPDFAAVGVVAGDRIKAYATIDDATSVYYDLVVVSVSGNEITYEFATPPIDVNVCPVAVDTFDTSPGSSAIVVEPNRIIQAQGLPDTGDDTENRARSPNAVLNTGQASLLYGFTIRGPSTGTLIRHVLIEDSPYSGSGTTNIFVDGTFGGTIFSHAVHVSGSSRGTLPNEGHVSYFLDTGTRTNVGHTWSCFFSGESISSVFRQTGSSYRNWNHLSLINGNMEMIDGNPSAYIQSGNIVANLGSTRAVSLSDNAHLKTEYLLAVGDAGIGIRLFRFSSLRIRFGEMRILGRDAMYSCVETRGQSRVDVDFNATARFSCTAAFFAWAAVGESTIAFKDSQTDFGELNSNVFAGFAEPNALITFGRASLGSTTTYSAFASTSFIPWFDIHFLNRGAPQVVTLPSQLGGPSDAVVDAATFFQGKVYYVYTKSAFTHTLLIDAGGATWDGTNRAACFDGNVGSGLSFLVLDATTITVIDNKGVTFAADTCP